MTESLIARRGRAAAALACVLTSLAGTDGLAADKASDKSRPSEAETFATVGQTVVSVTEYEQAFALAVRRKYYHGKVHEAELDALRREVAESVVNRVLLVGEARRRGIQPDRDAIKRTIAGYDARYKGSDEWKKNRKQMVAAVTRQLEQQSQLERLEATVRKAPEPTEAQAREYYDAHRDLFVEPEQLRVALILLRVDPSSPKIAWEKATEEASAIVARLRNGAQFEELARLHSSDASAERGGDLGYLHRGMLPEAAQQVLDKLGPGMISDPVRVLEGVAVIRLLDRKPARQREFAEVRERAGDLWQREQGDTQWKQLIARLREGVPIRINTTRYPMLARAGADEVRGGAR